MTTVTVSNIEELFSALSASTGGETILLEGGNYGDLTLTAKTSKGLFDLDFEGATIASADPDNPAIFSTLGLNGVSNLTIDNVVFDYTYTAGDLYYTKPFTVNGSSNVTISNSLFDGDVASGLSEEADGYGYAYGLVVRGSSGVTVSGNEFQNWLRGAIFGNSTDLTVTGNEMHDIRSDGMNFSAVQNVLIEDNYFHDFRASYDSGDHRDMIQFWTNGTTTPSTDITITNNVFDIGDGSYTQSIFMRNEEVDTGRAGTEMYYQNVTITNNTIYNGHLHGITVGETDGLVIANNSVIAVADENNPDASSSSVWIPTIRVAAASINVEISGNAVAKITGYTDQTSWTVVSNVLIQNTDAYSSGYYGDVFVTSSMEASADGVHSYMALPGGALDAADAGSTETAAATDLGIEALYMVSDTDGGTVVFDASLTETLLGSQGSGATYVWTFGDGTTLEGVTVTHSYAEGSSYSVTLTVTTTDDRVLVAGSTVTVAGSEVVAYDPETQSFIAYYAGTATSLGQLASLDGAEIQLGASGTVAKISQDELKVLRGSDNFSIDFSLQADTVGSVGELFRFHVSFTASINQAGNLSFQIFDSTGTSKTLTSSGTNLSDGAEHDVSVQLLDGTLYIYIDGTVSGSTAFTGTLPTSGSWDLTFGNPWGKTNFNGDISAFAISADEDTYGRSSTQSSRLAGDDAGDDGATTANTSAEDASALTTSSDNATSATAENLSTQGQETAARTDGDTTDDSLSDSMAQAAEPATAQSSTSAQESTLASDGDSGETAPSDQITFSLDLSQLADMNGTEKVLWSRENLALTLDGDDLFFNIATADQGFKSYNLADLGMDATQSRNVTLMLDTASDRLEIVVDDESAPHTAGTDYVLDGIGDGDWGSDLGVAWIMPVEGEISTLQLIEDFTFLENDHSADGSVLLA